MAAIATTWGDTILTVIAREYSAKRHASKLLARHAKSSYRTAEHWLSGRSVPTTENLLNLMVSCEAMRDEIQSLIQERLNTNG